MVMEVCNPEQDADRDAQTAQRKGGNENQNPNQNVIVSVSALDTLIPVIPAANEASIKAKFKHQKLTKVSGKPTHTTMAVANTELARNAITSKTSFGCKR